MNNTQLAIVAELEARWNAMMKIMDHGGTMMDGQKELEAIIRCEERLEAMRQEEER